MIETTHTLLDDAANLLEAHDFRAVADLIRESQKEIPNVPLAPRVKLLGFAAAVREYGDDWRQHGFGWNGESYRGLTPHTMCALGESHTPDHSDAGHMVMCTKHGRMWQVK